MKFLMFITLLFLVGCGPSAIIKQEITVASYLSGTYYISTEVRVIKDSMVKSLEYWSVVECTSNDIDYLKVEEMDKANIVYDKAKKYLELK